MSRIFHIDCLRKKKREKLVIFTPSRSASSYKLDSVAFCWFLKILSSCFFSLSLLFLFVCVDWFSFFFSFVNTGAAGWFRTGSSQIRADENLFERSSHAVVSPARRPTRLYRILDTHRHVVTKAASSLPPSYYYYSNTSSPLYPNDFLPLHPSPKFPFLVLSSETYWLSKPLLWKPWARNPLSLSLWTWKWTRKSLKIRLCHFALGESGASSLKWQAAAPSSRDQLSRTSFNWFSVCWVRIHQSHSLRYCFVYDIGSLASST